MPNMPCQHIADVMDRYRAFFASRRPGLKVCTRLYPDEIPGLEPMPGLHELDWRNPDCFRAHARKKMANMRRARAVMPDVDDDRLPCMTNVMGTGAIAAVFVRDAVVHQEATTNYLDTPITSWDQGIDRIGFDPGNPYYQAYMAAVDVFVEEWDGSYTILPFSFFDPLDLCNQIRGNDIFYDFTDHQAELHALLRRCTQAILDMRAHMRTHHLKGYGVPDFAMDCWCPGAYLSCDIGDMIAADDLKEFGLPYTQQLVSAWGGSFLHHHELGARQIGTWSECRDLTVQYITRDPNTRHLADGGLTDDMIRSSFLVPIFFEATFDEFMAGVERWRQGRFIVGVLCQSAEQQQTVLSILSDLRGS
ncbi:MAG: hypothetical protein IT440_09565 [Phycisphaeraceae bacterium]|nr:hypothetical protein [Phycisphaeraceae bacterium]